MGIKFKTNSHGITIITICRKSYLWLHFLIFPFALLMFGTMNGNVLNWEKTQGGSIYSELEQQRLAI